MANRITRSRGLVRVPSQRRRVTWGSSDRETTFTVLAANTKVIDQVLDPGLLENVAVQESTVVRVRGILTIISDQASGVEEQIGALGFMIVSDEAVAAGAASVPGPAAQASNDDWFVWLPFGQQGLTTTASNQSKSYAIDSKAMRKFHAGTQIVVMMENQHATQGLSFFISFRMLFKLA